MLGRLVIASSAFFATSAYSLSHEQIADIVSTADVAFDTRDHGKLCELIGIAVMQEENPSAEIMNGIIYRKGHQTIGELDLVVLEEGQAREIIEVKCKKSYSSAASEANKQLNRFAQYAGRCDVDFSLEGDLIPCDVFATQSIVYSKMSYDDAVSKGFERSLGISRADLLDLIDP